MSSALLETTIDRWDKCREENEADKHLATPEQRKAWEDLNEATSLRLRAIVEEFDGHLSEKHRSYLISLNEMIDSAERVSREDLEAAKAKREEEERLAEEAKRRRAAELVETKKNLLEKLAPRY